MNAKKRVVGESPANAGGGKKKVVRSRKSAVGTAPGNTAAIKFLQSSLGVISRSRGDATEAVAEGFGRFAETIGLRKLEDVFDQRVAGALERMGLPTARELARLRDRVEQLEKQVGEMKSRPRK